MIAIVLIMALLLYVGVLTDAFTILALSTISVVIVYKGKMLYKHAHYAYILATIVAVLAMIFYQSPYVSYIQRGFLGYSFFLIVMFVGVLPNHWTLTRNIKINRGVFSILGFILISPHAWLRILGIVSFVNLYGIIAYALMVPLTIISFRIIRKQIPPKDWFRVQKAAYAIYGLLFVHLWMVALWQDRVVYAVLAALYVNNRLSKYAYYGRTYYKR